MIALDGDDLAGSGSEQRAREAARTWANLDDRDAFKRLGNSHQFRAALAMATAGAVTLQNQTLALQLIERRFGVAAAFVSLTMPMPA